MEHEAAREMAEALMRAHGLTGWSLVLDNARTRAGVCRSARREIGLSRVLTALHDEAQVRDTVLHEIAHALAGPEHAHDEVWRATAVAIGCSGSRCVPASAPRAPARWRGTCPAGHVVHRHRRPQRVMSCRRCAPTFTAAAVLSWTHDGREVAMPPQYVAELALVTHLDGAGAGDLAEAASRTPLPEARVRTRPYPRLPVGTLVRVTGRGRYAGVTGTVEKQGRTRYHVRTPSGLLTVPFALTEPR